MMPERMKFLDRFDNFYQITINAIKEDKINERDFYLIIRGKCRLMDRERRESLLLNKGSK
ncbi:hypothetical protein ES705_35015 [subsurface metagenome]